MTLHSDELLKAVQLSMASAATPQPSAPDQGVTQSSSIYALLPIAVTSSISATTEDTLAPAKAVVEKPVKEADGAVDADAITTALGDSVPTESAKKLRMAGDLPMG